jgi:hypothetical protein
LLSAICLSIYFVFTVFGAAIRQDGQRNYNGGVSVENHFAFAGGYIHTGFGVVTG